MSAKIKNSSRSRTSHHKHKPKGVSGQAFDKVHWPYIPVLAVILVLLSFSAQSGILQAAIKNPTGKVLAYASSMSVSGLLASTNSARAGNGQSSLTLNSKLNAAAQAKANDMASRNYWSHSTPEGNPPWVFVTNQNYSYQKLGENLAAGFSSEQTTVNGWMASPPHKKNMLDSAFSEVGFGYANNSNYTSAGGGPMTVVVAFYGKPSQASPPPAPPAPVAANVQETPPPAPPPSPSPSPPPSAPAETEPTPAEPAPAPVEQQPANTDSSSPSSPGPSLALRTSRAQLAFVDAPVSGFATGLVVFLMIGAAGYWLGRHLLAWRKLFASGESFVLRHPLLDLGLILTVVLSFLLIQTAGFIQ